MEVKKGKTYQGKVEKIVYGGKGIVRIGEFVVFVEKAITGQEIEFQITKLKKHYAQGKFRKILKKAPNEVSAKCRHFGECGGCKWQNLSYADQLKIKSQIVRENIENIVSADSYQYEEIVASPNLWNYRNKLDFSYGYQEMQIDKTDSENWIYHDLNPCLGFHRPKKFELILPIQNCEIAPKEANQILEILQKFREKNNLSVHNPKTHKGFLRNVIVRKGERTGEVLVNVIVNYAKTPLRGQGGVAPIANNPSDHRQENRKKNIQVQVRDIEPTAEVIRHKLKAKSDEKSICDSKLVPLNKGETGSFKPEEEQSNSLKTNQKDKGRRPLEAHFGSSQETLNQKFLELTEELKEINGIVGILLTYNNSWNDAVIDGKTEVLWGRDFLYDKIGNFKFKISPEAFFQTNTLGAKELYDTAKEFANLTGKEKVLDLYCGTGTIGLYLSDKAEKIYGIELVAPAIENAKINAKLNQIKNAEFICGNIDKSLHDLLEKVESQIDVVILDPPRVGVGKKALKRVLEIQAKKIVYVSCNPTTFARDLEILNINGYQLKRVRAVDMFPHTHHIEMVAELEVGF